MLISGASLPGQRGRVDLRLDGGVIQAMAPRLSRRRGEALLEAAGGAALPGLHDHHIHLYALAARRASVDCGPRRCADAAALAGALRAAPGTDWIRALGYHHSVAGNLDRYALDRWVADRPLRLQHRSGKLWILNSLALQRLGLDTTPASGGVEMAGLERDGSGWPTGRFYRLDDWLGRRLRQFGQRPQVGLRALSAQLARLGISGVTDASADNAATAMASFEDAAASGAWRQHLRVMGTAQLPVPEHPLLSRGERKILLDEDRLPDLAALVADCAAAHAQDRGVALHCVTPTELVFALSALGEAGAHPRDRIEHASLLPDELLPLLRERGVCVVTQPGFIAERGEQYLAELESAQHPQLYRCAGVLAAGIPLAGSSDAPYTAADPWAAMRAAVARSTATGAVLGPAECLTPEQALRLFTGAADAPGGRPRRIAVGAPADLCLLDRPWSEARRRLCADDVLATFCAGEPIYLRAGGARGRAAARVA
ncbi:MAG: hydrolase [Halioglobus sp.]|nr:hydrolase [Halioglobus sp.]